MITNLATRRNLANTRDSLNTAWLNTYAARQELPHQHGHDNTILQAALDAITVGDHLIQLILDESRDELPPDIVLEEPVAEPQPAAELPW